MNFRDMDTWTGFAPAELQGATIRRVPCERASVIVTIDGQPYAGFVNRAAAEEAILLWSGKMTGGGVPISSPAPAESGWRAVRGRTLAIVER